MFIVMWSSNMHQQLMIIRIRPHLMTIDIDTDTDAGSDCVTVNEIQSDSVTLSSHLCAIHMIQRYNKHRTTCYK